MILLYTEIYEKTSGDTNFETFSKFVIGEKNMITYERQELILSHLKENRFATIKDLSKIVWASESSVRRDLKALEQKGLVTQIYGGVTLADFAGNVVPIGLRDSYNSTVKDELAKRASKHIFDGATIFMDGSSTVKRIIPHLNHFTNLKIITNNQLIFSECNNPGIKLYCTGGLYNSQSNIFAGSAAESYIDSVSADILFFSSQAISDEGEISDVSEEETSLRKKMLARSKKKIFLCDSSKLGLKKTFTLCRKDDVDAIICDKKLPWE